MKPEKARSTYYAKDIKVLGNRIIIILLLHISFYIPTFSQYVALFLYSEKVK